MFSWPYPAACCDNKQSYGEANPADTTIAKGKHVYNRIHQQLATLELSIKGLRSNVPNYPARACAKRG